MPTPKPTTDEDPALTATPPAETPTPAPAPLTPVAGRQEPEEDANGIVTTALVTTDGPAPPADGGGSASGAPPEPAALGRQAQLRALKEAGVPTIAIGDAEIPLYGFAGMATWGLLNLALCIAGAALAAAMLIAALAKRGKQPVSIGLPATAIIAGIASAVTFLLTQDMAGLTVWLDAWAIPMAALLAVEIVCAVTMRRRGKNYDTRLEAAYRREYIAATGD
jgi:hypothetical protein